MNNSSGINLSNSISHDFKWLKTRKMQIKIHTDHDVRFLYSLNKELKSNYVKKRNEIL